MQVLAVDLSRIAAIAILAIASARSRALCSASWTQIMALCLGVLSFVFCALYFVFCYLVFEVEGF